MQAHNLVFYEQWLYLFIYSKECLNKWKDEGKNTCPFCRALIDPNAPANRIDDILSYIFNGELTSQLLLTRIYRDAFNPRDRQIRPPRVGGATIRRTARRTSRSSLNSLHLITPHRPSAPVNGGIRSEQPHTPRPAIDEEELIGWSDSDLELHDELLSFLDDEPIREPHPLPVDDSPFHFLPINPFEPLHPLPQHPYYVFSRQTENQAPPPPLSPPPLPRPTESIELPLPLPTAIPHVESQTIRPVPRILSNNSFGINYIPFVDVDDRFDMFRERTPHENTEVIDLTRDDDEEEENEEVRTENNHGYVNRRSKMRKSTNYNSCDRKKKRSRK